METQQGVDLRFLNSYVQPQKTLNSTDLGRCSQKGVDPDPVFLVKASTWQESNVPVLLTIAGAADCPNL